MFKLLIGLLYSWVFSDSHSKKNRLLYYCSPETHLEIAKKLKIYVLIQRIKSQEIFIFFLLFRVVFTVSIQASRYYLCVLVVLKSVLPIIIFRVWTTKYLLYFYLHGDYSKTNLSNDIFRQLYSQDVLFLQEKWFSELIERKNFLVFYRFRTHLQLKKPDGSQSFYGFQRCLKHILGEPFRSAASRSSAPLWGATHG